MNPKTSYCIDANYWKGTTAQHYLERHKRQLAFEKKVDNYLGNIYGNHFHDGYAGSVFNSKGVSPTIRTMQGGGQQPMSITYEKYEPGNNRDRSNG